MASGSRWIWSLFRRQSAQSDPDELELNVETQDAFVRVRADIDRARGLLSSAIDGLTTSFQGMKASGDQQRRLLEQLLDDSGDADCAESHGFARFAASTQGILNDFVDHIVNSSRNSMRLVHRMEDVHTSMDAIHEALGELDEIARKTHLLGLNAEIEAARFAKEGAAFSIVAQEVRRLAARSESFSKRISGVVVESKRCVDEATEIIREIASQDMSSTLESQREVEEMLVTVSTMNERAEDTARQAMEISSALNSAVTEGVRSLQFEDLVGQLLAANGDHVESLSQITALSFSLLSSLREDGLLPDARWQRFQADVEAALDKVQEELTAEKQIVQQQDMQVGDVELF